MILSNEELFKALDSGRLVIQPEPLPRYAEVGMPENLCPYSTDGVDLRLDSEFTIPETGAYAYDPTQMQTSMVNFIRRTSRRITVPMNEDFILERNVFVLAQTLEDVRLPIDHQLNRETGTCLAARIEGKSSRARIGLLIHFTAPTVHAGWEGKLTLEIINLGSARIILKPGMPIAQLTVEEVKGIPAKVKPSQFQHQVTPEGGKQPK